MNWHEDFAKNPRVTVRNNMLLNAEGDCVVYWMQRSQRARDNPALNVAVEAANVLAKPVVVFFGLRSDAHHANFRHYQFMVEGLREIADGLRQRSVGFVLRRAPDHGILRFCSEVAPCLVISDEDPQRRAEKGRTRAARELKAPFWTVDGDVIVPTRLLGKEHYAARTIRPKLHALLARFFEPLTNPNAHVAWQRRDQLRSLDAGADLLAKFPMDRSVGPVSMFRGGSAAARRALAEFLKARLSGYATQRNKPEIDGTSQLSPYLHFGQMGPHTVATAVRDAQAPAVDCKAYLEEFIVRRELAINFVRYNSHYDSFDASEPWADRTLRIHSVDERKYIYTEAQLENGETHDPLWNAGQKQMTLTGWMHGYLRMYWAKKILEWSPSPAEAFDIAIRLNDRYELDGRDPNGYAGIAWAMVGKHDRAWGPERPVYGKIRYMSYGSTSRKFDSTAFIARVAALERARGSAFKVQGGQ